MNEIKLKNKSLDYDKLKAYGFSQNGSHLFYSKKILNGEFLLEIYVLNENDYKTKLIEIDTGEEYVLHLMPNAEGAFVGRVRDEIESIIEQIVKVCAKNNVFEAPQSQSIITYVREKYGRELEFLWDSFPVGAIWRRSDNQKWFGIMMNVPINRLGVAGDEMVDIVNVRAEACNLIDNEYVFPAYHMNKKSWVSVLLNKGLNDEKLFALIDESFVVALDKKKKVLV